MKEPKWDRKYDDSLIDTVNNAWLYLQRVGIEGTRVGGQLHVRLTKKAKYPKDTPGLVETPLIVVDQHIDIMTGIPHFKLFRSSDVMLREALYLMAAIMPEPAFPCAGECGLVYPRDLIAYVKSKDDWYCFQCWYDALEVLNSDDDEEWCMEEPIWCESRLPDRLYSCANDVCAAERSYSPDGLYLKRSTGEFFCQECWDGGDQEQHSLEAIQNMRSRLDEH